jgi:hypothetical protein
MQMAVTEEKMVGNIKIKTVTLNTVGIIVTASIGDYKAEAWSESAALKKLQRMIEINSAYSRSRS